MYVIISNTGEPVTSGSALPEPTRTVGVLSATGKEVKVPVYNVSPIHLLSSYAEKIKVITWNEFVHSDQFKNVSIL